MPHLAPLFRFTTFPADAVRALTGANEGDAIGLGDAALAGDTYRLSRDAVPRRLTICDGPDGGQVVARGSEVGDAGEPLRIAACHSLMGETGEMIEVLVLEHASASMGLLLHLLPLSPLKPGTEYELIGSSTATAPDRFADIASVSFFAGTHLTLAGGAQARVEDLQGRRPAADTRPRPAADPMDRPPDAARRGGRGPDPHFRGDAQCRARPQAFAATQALHLAAP